MAVWCFGSVNIDLFYDVPHIPAPGETLAARSMFRGLGGKGANQSVASAKAGVATHHIGAIGPDSDWVIERLESYGVDTRHIALLDTPTGQAVINVAADGENAIVILPGANAAQSAERLEAALATASGGDILLLQNEANLQVEAAKAAKAKGMRVVYSAAPFDAGAVEAILPHIEMLLMNEVEAAQLEASLGKTLYELEVPQIVITLGAKGARLIDTRSGDAFDVQGHKVDAADTTGAGDTFAGYLAAGLAEGTAPQQAMELAGRAAALKVTRKGTADTIPSRAEVEGFQP